MPIIGPMDHKTPKGKAIVAAIYLLLILGGLTMIGPFLVMFTGSLATPFDFERRSLAPRFFWSEEDRFMRFLVSLFPPAARNSLAQMKSCFPSCPADWEQWTQIGDEPASSDAWARSLLAELRDPVRRPQIETAARDYRDFMANLNLRETTLAFNDRFVGVFLRGRYRSLAEFNAAWEVSVDDFMQLKAPDWGGDPFDLPTFVPGASADARSRDLLAFRQAYREGRFTPWLQGLPASQLRPAALRFTWESFVRARGPQAAALGPVAELPFPVPANATDPLQETWHAYLEQGFALRHIRFAVTPARQAAFRQFLIDRFRTPEYAARVLELPVTTWDDLPLTGTVPETSLAGIWFDFVKTSVPSREWQVRDTLPEQSYQKFALARHGSLATLNAAYGLHLASIEQLRIPYREAVLASFAARQWSITLHEAVGNYGAVVDYLFRRGKAVRNTLILVGLSLVVTLTVNPLCAYALSRFRLRQTEKIIVFCLTTMAFPAAVSAIPGFLLLRDLGLLNTFAALILPGAASGMSIFLLKGFFDSLPQELFEAATIDGASEWQVFTLVSLPLVKPILAVSLLGAFVGAYAGWEWALIVCQDQNMWTVSVWTYQFSQSFASQPFVVMAAYVITSIPVLLVFFFCQKIILRGIVLPHLK